MDNLSGCLKRERKDDIEITNYNWKQKGYCDRKSLLLQKR